MKKLIQISASVIGYLKINQKRMFPVINVVICDNADGVLEKHCKSEIYKVVVMVTSQQRKK